MIPPLAQFVKLPETVMTMGRILRNYSKWEEDLEDRRD
jgi:hypothetical protein